ncbi:hypothetical protein [Actinocorallia populi]|uniref:hypothetical protein n=1 Tax=Actinocorallia populi TaxID=2079200 RepID=UPI001300BC5C|nr:hypothetical protein [Actinocorallia populi]
MCERLPRIYPEFYQAKKAPGHTKSTFGNLLNGQSRGLPSPKLVRTYILCCLAIGRENGRPDLGPDAVRERLEKLQKKLQKFADDAHADGLFVWRGYRPGVRRYSPEQIWFRSTDSAVPCDLASAEPRELTGEQRDAIAGYGSYGEALLQRVRRRDPHAFYQSALLLTVRAADDEKITELLIASGAVEHEEAMELLEADPHGIDRFAARDHAFRLAVLAEESGHTEAAKAFSTCVELLEGLTRPEPLESPDNQAQEQPPP